MSIFGDYFDDDYYKEEHEDEYVYSVTLSQVSDFFTLGDAEFEWHANNRKWIFKNNYTYKFRSNSISIPSVSKPEVVRNSYIREYTYYFKDKNAAMLFGLWCSREL